MTVSSIQSSPFPWPPMRTPAQGVVVQSTSDIQATSQTTRPALPPAQAQANSDALFAQQWRQERLAHSNEDKPTQDTKSRSSRSAEPRLFSALSDDQQTQLNQLKARDAEVRQHEAAHQAAGGAFTGAASFTYTRGPDGARYAIGGEVSVDKSPIPGKPEETIAKMRTIEHAALAPAEPSPQDRRVAADAARARLQAQSELLQQQNKSRTQANASHDTRYQHRAKRAVDDYQATANTSPS